MELGDPGISRWMLDHTTGADTEQPSTAEQPAAGQTRVSKSVLEVDTEDEDSREPQAKRVYRSLMDLLSQHDYRCPQDSQVAGKLICTICSTEKEHFLLQKRVVNAERHVRSESHKK
jgi:hypothetical protein